MKINKEHIIILIFSIILIFIVFAIAYSALFQPEIVEEPNSTPTTTPQASRPTDPIVMPSETKTNTPVQYNSEATQRMLDRLASRIPLAQSDSSAKERILSLLPPGQVSGIIYRSTTIMIDYTNAADQFQVEILTVNIGQAKTDANSWFELQGMSKEGICNLPVVFYLNYDVAQNLRGSNIQFNPLAEGC